MPRIASVERGSLSPEDQKIWDAIAATRGGIHGPYGVLMRVPQLADRMAKLGDYFRNEGLLSGADRELAILSAAREIGSRYEWVRHEATARQQGARPEAIECVRKMRYGRLNEHELVIVEVVQSLFRTKLLPAAVYHKAVKQLGEDRLVELVALSGFYCAIAFVLEAFEVALPSGAEAGF